MWCMWLSDLGSGFGQIVKCKTDLQKKCQMGLHNDKNGARKSSVYAGFRALCMWSEYSLSAKLLFRNKKYGNNAGIVSAEKTYVFLFI